MPALLWLLLLCLVEGSSWFLPTSQTSLATLNGLGGLVAGVLWFAAHAFPVEQRGIPGPVSRSGALPWAAAGAIALPSILLSLAQPLAGGTTGAILLAAAPAFAVCTLHVLDAQSGDLGQSLLPVITGLAGALFLLPFSLPTNRSGWLGFALDLLAAACAGVFGTLARQLSSNHSPASSFRLIALGNAPALLAGALVVRSTLAGTESLAEPLSPIQWLLVAAVSLGTSALTFWCLGQLPAVSVASRFVLIPLVIAAESWAVWRPSLSFRDIIGALLMLFSFVMACRKQAPLPSTILPRRHD